jgi:transposase
VNSTSCHSHQNLPIIVNKSPEEIDALIKRLNGTNLSKDEQEFFTGCVELATWLPEVLRENKISIRQLQRLIFAGNAPNKKKKKKEGRNKSNNADEKAIESTPDPFSKDELPSPSNQTETNCATAISAVPVEKSKIKGHGRIAHTAYANAIEISVKSEGLKVGDLCPLNCGGKLYLLKPGIVVRIIGNPLATVNKYLVEKLRCALCCDVFKAQLPKEVSPGKYDARFKAIIATQKYYVGVPFYRQANFQSYMNFPLASSVQYELSEQVADCCYPLIGVLEKGIADSKYVHNDDTRVKILSVIKNNKPRLQNLWVIGGSGNLPS